MMLEHIRQDQAKPALPEALRQCLQLNKRKYRTAESIPLRGWVPSHSCALQTQVIVECYLLQAGLSQAVEVVMVIAAGRGAVEGVIPQIRLERKQFITRA